MKNISPMPLPPSFFTHPRTSTRALVFTRSPPVTPSCRVCVALHADALLSPRRIPSCLSGPRHNSKTAEGSGAHGCILLCIVVQGKWCLKKSSLVTCTNILFFISLIFEYSRALVKRIFVFEFIT